MNTQNKKGSLLLPTIYEGSSSNRQFKSGAITLEALIILAKEIDLIENEEDLINDFCFCLIILTWCAQTFVAAKLNVPQMKGSSKEKTFQQTNSHGTFTKIIANSNSFRRLNVLAAMLEAINKGFYEYGIPEDQPIEIFLKSQFNENFEDLMEQKGSGTLKIAVRDSESRLVWLKGNTSSRRSIWCTTSVFSPKSLISSNLTLKNVDINFIERYKETISDNYIKKNVIQNAPTEALDQFVTEQLKLLNINTNLDDNMFGNLPPVALDSALGLTREESSAKSVKKVTTDYLERLKTVPKKTVKSKGTDTVTQQTADWDDYDNQ